MAFDFARLSESFFDRGAVLDGAERAKRKAFSKAGAFIRQRARSSIRKKKGSAPPGKPPHSHSGQLRLIFFSWSAASGSVVVGPIEFQAKRGPKMGARLLERGGEGTATDRKGRARRLFFRGNPFMVPAMLAEAPKFAGLFKGSFGG